VGGEKIWLSEVKIGLVRLLRKRRLKCQKDRDCPLQKERGNIRHSKRARGKNKKPSEWENGRGGVGGGLLFEGVKRRGNGILRKKKEAELGGEGAHSLTARAIGKCGRK